MKCGHCFLQQHVEAQLLHGCSERLNNMMYSNKEYCDQVSKISSNWSCMDSQITYRQLLERLCETHKVELEEAADILSVAHIVSKMEGRRSCGDSTVE